MTTPHVIPLQTGTCHVEHARPTFYTRAGWLTAYALACGYREATTVGECDFTLWAEHGVYHVRGHRRFANGGRLFWESFDTLAEARAFYARKVAEYRA